MEDGLAFTCRGEPPCPVGGRGDEGACWCGTAGGSVGPSGDGTFPSTEASFVGGKCEASVVDGDRVLASVVRPWPCWVAVCSAVLLAVL